MRDERFKAIHRGGTLDLPRHRLLAVWAADCAEHVVALFHHEFPCDERPRRAIEAARRWARGEVTVGEARIAAVAAHAAAREAVSSRSAAAARAAGHAAGTAHMADHAPQAAGYAVQAVQASVDGPDAVVAANRERAWQRDHLPGDICVLVSRPTL